MHAAAPPVMLAWRAGQDDVRSICLEYWYGARCVLVPVTQGRVDVVCHWWGFMVERVVVLVCLVIGDEGGEVVLVVDVEDRDGVV